MPGKRTPADPLNMNLSVRDTDPEREGIQQENPKVGGQYRQGQAPPENTYREKPNTP